MKKFYLLLVATVATTSSFAQLDGTIWVTANQEQSLAVGPAQGDFSWWSIDAQGLIDRACYFDDTYVFNADGTFNNVQQGDTWLEPWQGVSAETCGAPVAPHDGSNLATWAYDASAGTVTLTGQGAYLGLPKVFNGGELSTAGTTPPAFISYPVTLNATQDTMTIDINFGPGFWHFVLAKSGSVGIDELDENLFNVYPNPANDIININSTGQVDQLVIYDITGKQVISNTNLGLNETISVSELPRGLYMVEVKSGNKKLVKKLILS